MRFRSKKRRQGERDGTGRRVAVPAMHAKQGVPDAGAALQARHGNTGLQALLTQLHGPPSLQRQPDPNAPNLDAPPPSDAERPIVDIVSIAQPILAELILAPPKDPKRARTAELVFKDAWPRLRAWILTVGTKKPARIPDAFSPLDVEGIKDELVPMTRAQRLVVADGVRDALVVDVGKQTPETYRAEFDKLDKKVRDAIEPSADPLVGYVAMREGMKATFGSIDALNDYFTNTLVAAEFPPVPQKVLGQQSLVHPDLHAALKRAAGHLQKQPGKVFDTVVDSISGIETINGKKHHRGSWSISIRENRNRPSDIGNHSFGFAIDIDANFNPNLPDFRWNLVKQVTGFDVYNKDDIAATRPNQPYATALASARKFRDASDRFVAAFDTRASFQETLGRLAKDAGMAFDPDTLLDAVELAARPGKSGAESLALLKQALLLAMEREDTRKAAQGQTDDTMRASSTRRTEAPIVYTIVGQLRKRITGRANLEQRMEAIAAQLRDPKDRMPATLKGAGLDFLFTRAIVAEIRALSAEVRNEIPADLRARLDPIARTADAAALAKLLVELQGVFSRTRDKAGNKIPPGSSLPAVAARGFMNLQPELVAALTSSEGGNLIWLGSTMGTKDWMHFQLAKPPTITPKGTWP